LVEAIRICAKSLTNPDGKPGLMYASGLEYTINKDGELLNMTFVDKYGNKTPIDVNNPRADKIYSVAINDYSSRGNDGLTMLNKYDKATEKYDWDITVAIREKIEKTKQPIDIIDDGRIKIV
jgi:2',3'-cyclic-nucleotide 2'-phosphodiesterase (5'-nucleotidase family)